MKAAFVGELSMQDLFRLIVRNSWRHPVRSALTILGVTMALLSFCFIHTVVGAWLSGVEHSAKNRLIVRNSVSLIFYLPLAYYEQVLNTPGVAKAGYGNWFGGMYKNERVRFQQFAINDAYLDVYPEQLLTPSMRERFARDRQGALIGRQVADKYGLKEGDRLELQGTIFPGIWEFNIAGIFEGRDPQTDTRLMYFHWEYLNERNKAEIQRMPDHIGFFAVEVAPGIDPAVVGKALDQKFANSPFETLSESETAFIQGFVSMSSTIISSLRLVSLVVIAIMLLVLTNTMLMSARERSREYAILKAIGFGKFRLLCLICGEALFLCLSGFVLLSGILAVAFSLPPRRVFGGLVDYFPSFALLPWTVWSALAAALLIGFISGVVPGWRIIKLRVTETLRRVE